MPSSCEFLAIIRRKEETKRLKQLELLFGVFKRSYNVTMVQSISPTSFPSPFKRNVNYWLLLKVKLLSLLSFISCHISVTGLTPSKVKPVMWLFSRKLPIYSIGFFLKIYYNNFYFCLQSCKSHLQENEKSMCTMGQFSGTDSLLLKDRSSRCSLDLIDLVM